MLLVRRNNFQGVAFFFDKNNFIFQFRYQTYTLRPLQSENRAVIWGWAQNIS
jgi:hypothetical protein